MNTRNLNHINRNFIKFLFQIYILDLKYGIQRCLPGRELKEANGGAMPGVLVSIITIPDGKCSRSIQATARIW